MRVGLMVQANQGGQMAKMLEQIQRAEADGFAAVWLPNTFAYDAVMLLALAGRVTARIELGTAVVPTYPRHPMALAQQALTAQEACGGRFALGIGLSHRVVIEGMLGLDYSKPLRHTREYLAVLNGLLAGEPAEFAGEEYRVKAQLRMPGVPAPPVLVAALGRQMLGLAGRQAAGTITWMGGLKYLESMAVPIITRAAREAGRPAPRIVAGFPVVVTKAIEAARATANRVFAVYNQLPAYRAVLDVEGAADVTGASIIGDEAEVEQALRRLADIGVTDLCAAPFPLRDDPAANYRTRELLIGWT